MEFLIYQIYSRNVPFPPFYGRKYTYIFTAQCPTLNFIMACCSVSVTHYITAQFKSAPLIAESTDVCSDINFLHTAIKNYFRASRSYLSVRHCNNPY
jgi:hypothetical protein